MIFRGNYSKIVSYIIPFLVFFSILFPQGVFGAGERRQVFSRAGTFIPGEVVVTLSDPNVQLEQASNRVFGQIVSGVEVVDFGIQKQSHIRKDVGRRFLLSYDPALGDPEAIAAKLRARPFVRAAGPNYVYHATQTTNDPSFHLSDSLYNTGGNSGRTGEILDADIDIEQAWATTKGSGSIIAVVDSGVDIDHADLASNIWNNSADPVDGIDNDGDGFIDDTHGWNFVAFDYPVGMGPCGVAYTSRPVLDPNLTESNDPRPKPNGVDEDGCNGADSGAIHGTHVAGIAAARVNNAEGTAGVAPEATIMPLRALDDEGSGDTNQIIDAIDFALAHNADVVNMSFSTGPLASPDANFDVVVDDARAANVVLVAAAGNNNDDLVSSPESPAANDCGATATLACNAQNLNKVIGVASTANDDNKASYSNFSSAKNFVDISAPGGDGGVSQAIYSTAYQDNAYDCCKSPAVVGGYAYEEGTSMAAPVVSGVVALIRSAYPSMSASDVTDRIRNFTDSIGVANLGQGRVNAVHAVLGSRVTRSSGATRYDTAIQTSEFTFPVDGTASAVVLASGENFPDGLGASALARVKNGPLLLTPKTALTAATLTEINRVLSDKTKTIYVVGGTAVIDSAIDSALTTDGFTSVQRVSGADRVATAQQVANLVSPGTVGSVVMVGKSNFPDALPAAAVVAKRSVPLFLNSANALDVSNLSWFQMHSVTRVYVVGGTAVVSDAVVSSLNGHGISVIRLSGSDRYETSASVAKCFFSTTTDSPCYGITAGRAMPEHVGAALGTNFPDALSGGPYIGFYSGPLLLVQNNAVPTPVGSYIQSLGSVRDVVLFGGSAVVSDVTVLALDSAL